MNALAHTEPLGPGDYRRSRVSKPILHTGFSYTLIPSPMGPLGVGRSKRGICRIDFHPETEDTFEAKLTTILGIKPVFDPGSFQDLYPLLEAYFSGKPQAFRIPLDLSGITPFQQEVLEALRSIPFGKSLSYSSLARLTGHPGAHRAVGGACGRNPVPLIIPCHRVLQSDGRLGGFSAGLEIKRRLLRHEGIDFSEKHEPVTDKENDAGEAIAPRKATAKNE